MIYPKLRFNKNFSFEDWLVYIRSQHSIQIDMSLERIKSVAKKMNLFHPAPIVIVVSGTNGKGTTCNVIEKILIQSNVKTGVYSSPHLISYTERIRISGKEVSERLLCNAFYDIEKSKEKIVTLTEFEYGTLAALKIFKKSQLEIAILEVGLGGRLDATNIIDSDISIIVNIARDHVKFLGNDREKIGYQKCGIFRYGKTSIIGETDIPNSVQISAKKLMTDLFIYGRDWIFEIEKNCWQWKSGECIFRKLPFSESIPINNVATGLAAIYLLKKNYVNLRKKIKNQHIRNGILNAKLPGRFQIIHLKKGPITILDVAHNFHAAQYLSKRLDYFQSRRKKIYAITSILRDKDINLILSVLKDKIWQWNFVSNFQDERGLSSKDLSRYMKKSFQHENFLSAYESVLKEIEKNVLLVFGSFYIVSEYLKMFS
ncbi:FolC bifunctional protein [Candidatus Riesia pediculicola USDA]|uniref:Dihydrofolate synthase/folylpolyglutamate synthase n=1 Tax=Riesia pediculicola (strain USDA) TaxID=515618 RepID=D4G8T5_RIEPU|nr:bifunctional tetrahydrofolate synthase/dihydrofolate synthase [Candidatus Riesia pediculicola]ADD79593.1 FolC bifunctional protein [Candidatus Riesia pediculicola USDA]